MKRRLFSILSVISLLLFVAVLALRMDRGTLLGATRTRTATRIVRGPDSPKAMYMVEVDNWTLMFGWAASSGKPVPGPLYRSVTIPTAIADWQSSFPHSAWRWNGLSYWEDAWFIDQGGRVWMQGRQTWVRIPFWALLIAFAILPVWRWLVQRRKWRRQARLRRGHCPTCDYDLRASEGRCPECGTPISPLHPAQQV